MLSIDEKRRKFVLAADPHKVLVYPVLFLKKCLDPLLLRLPTTINRQAYVFLVIIAKKQHTVMNETVNRTFVDFLYQTKTLFEGYILFLSTIKGTDQQRQIEAISINRNYSTWQRIFQSDSIYLPFLISQLCTLIIMLQVLFQEGYTRLVSLGDGFIVFGFSLKVLFFGFRSGDDLWAYFLLH